MNADPTELLALATRLVGDVVPALVEAHHNRVVKGAKIAVRTKTSANDLVTEMDQWCERTLVDGLLSARPDDGILGEEGAAIVGTSGVRWVIDPIDGTTNYFYDLPGYSVSVAAQVEGETVVGVVADPVRDELFTAMRGQGAHRNGWPIVASDKADLSTALVATGFNYDLNIRVEQAKALVSIAPQVRDIRRIGGAALDICLIAAGRADAYYEAALSIWDVAAATLIATEAGAIHTDIGGRVDLPGTTVVSAPAIHDELLTLLDSCGAAWKRPSSTR